MYRLIYKSRSRQPVDWQLIEEILESSESNNQKKAISGALVATSSHFLQLIEGDTEVINKLFMKIARDDRHCDVQLIGFDCIENRMFEDWAMHGIGIFNFNVSIIEPLLKKYGTEDGQLRIPTETWQALSLIADLRAAES